MKFKFGDRVNMDRVVRFDWNTEDFYKDQVGIVINVNHKLNGRYLYDVKLKGDVVATSIEEHQLDLAPRKRLKPLGSLRS